MLSKLTSSQEALLPMIRDKWLAVGLSTQPADREKAVAAARVAYAKANLKEPQMIVWLNSPLAGAIGAQLLSSIEKDQVWDQVQVGAQVRAQVRDQVWDQVRAQVRAQVWDQVWDQVQVGAQVRDQVQDQVWVQVGAQVRDQVQDQVWDQVRDQVWVQVGAQVRDQVWDQVWDQVQVGAQVRAQVYRCGYGLHDANWVGFYQALGKFGIDVSKLQAITDLTQSCGWYWTFAGAIILTERPVRLSRNAQHQLHDESGMAIEYPDGWGLYCLNGVRVPSQLVTTPAEQMDCQFILKERNAEIRREFVRKAGIEKVCKDLGAKEIDRQDNYELLLLNIGDGRERPYLKMQNPSIGVYHIEGVAPDCRNVKQALNWRNSLTDAQIDEVNGADWYQQGDVVMRPSGVKTFKSQPIVLT